MIRKLFPALPLFLLSGQALADVKLPAILGENTVLQRETEVPLWGWADPAEEVTITAGWMEETLTTRADEKGEWQVKIKTPQAGGPFTLTFSARNQIELQNVLIGEVWICSGQSNMEMPLGNINQWYTGVLNHEEEIAAAEYPWIRIFQQENRFAASPASDTVGSWQECSSAIAENIPATAYFFGRELHQHLGIPIGLISADWGGTVAEAWMSESIIRTFPEFEGALKEVALVREHPEVLEEDYRKRMEAQKQNQGAAEPGKWQEAGFNDGSWKTTKVPSTWEGEDLGGFDGIVLFRRTVQIPREWVGKDLRLELGPIDDRDVTFFNGKQVGKTWQPGYWGVDRNYIVPASAVQAGTNIIGVRVLDTGGPGGFGGQDSQLRLRPAGSGESIPLAGEWKYFRGTEARFLNRPAPLPPSQFRNKPTALFNGMVAPILPFAIRGAIWYQGESNRSRPDQYRQLFPALIRDWRRAWDRGDFPFYYVQIAPYNYSGDPDLAAGLREAQRLAMREPQTGMAVTMDIGDLKDIHPKNKQAVGKRLARWALAQDYGLEILPSGPLPKSWEIYENTLRVSFDHVGKGLRLKDRENHGFEIRGQSGEWVQAEVNLEWYMIAVLSHPEVPQPVAARYGWTPGFEGSLINAEGLPASPFTTEEK